MINWKLRLQNKATLVTLIGGLVALVYQILALIGITPKVSESDVINIFGMVINLLVLLGIVVDPTTAGVSDSVRALDYDAPSYDDGDYLEYLLNEDEDEFEDDEDDETEEA